MTFTEFHFPIEFHCENASSLTAFYFTSIQSQGVALGSSAQGLNTNGKDLRGLGVRAAALLRSLSCIYTTNDKPVHSALCVAVCVALH